MLKDDDFLYFVSLSHLNLIQQNMICDKYCIACKKTYQHDTFSISDSFR